MDSSGVLQSGPRTVGGILFGTALGVYTTRIDPLATDEQGNIPVTELMTFGLGGGSPIQTITVAPTAAGNVFYAIELDAATQQPGGQLLRVDLRQQTAQRVGAPFNRKIKALVALGGPSVQLIGVAEGSPSDELVRLPASGGPTVTVIGPMGYTDVWGLAVHPNGDLYASAITNVGLNKVSHILLIDPVTGLGTVQATFPKEIFSLAFTPCPFPCLSPPISSVAWKAPQKLVATDFNRDGNDDLVVLAARDPVTGDQGSVNFLRSNGDGTFTNELNYPLPGQGSGGPPHLEAADLNGDTWPDIVSVNWENSPPGLAVFLNDGAGHFSTAAYLPTGDEPGGFAVGRVDGDSIPDILVAVYDGIKLLKGDGAGGFTDLGVVYDPYWGFPSDRIRLADLENDGDLDFVSTESTALHWGLNDGNGNFTSDTIYDSVGGFGAFELGDVTGDGVMDLVEMFPGLGARVRPGLGTGLFGLPQVERFIPRVSYGLITDFVLADLDQNGVSDVVFAAPQENAVHIWMSRTSGTGWQGFEPARSSPATVSSPWTLAAGDFDGGASVDLAIGERPFNFPGDRIFVVKQD